jgi:hypothetical protein
MSREDVWGWFCAAALVVIIGFFTIAQFIGEPEDDPFKGPIPSRFQGAYNSLGCDGVQMAGLVTVGGKSISYGGARFEATSVVSRSDTSITLRGDPIAAGGTESARTFTITYAPVGGTARLDGGEFERCSQYGARD